MRNKPSRLPGTVVSCSGLFVFDFFFTIFITCTRIYFRVPISIFDALSSEVVSGACGLFFRMMYDV